MTKSNLWPLNEKTWDEPAIFAPETEHNNHLTFRRVMSKFDLKYETDSSQNDYVVCVNRFVLSFNPLAQFAIHFPYFSGIPIRQAQLEAVVLPIATVSRQLYDNYAYTKAMEQFCLLCGELPIPVFVYNYPYLYLRPYHPDYFGKPSFSTKYTLSERDEITGVWLKRFVINHFLRIGALAQQYGHILELP